MISPKIDKMSSEDNFIIHSSSSEEILEVHTSQHQDKLNDCEQLLGQVIVPEHTSGWEHSEQISANSEEDNEASRVRFKQRMRMMEGFSERLEQRACKVKFNEGAASSVISTKALPSPSISSANRTGIRTDRPLNESLDSRATQWPEDKESETLGSLVEVSVDMVSFLQSGFGKLLNSSLGRGLLVFIKWMPRSAKIGLCGQRERVERHKRGQHHRLQTLVPDAVAPLAHILESAQSSQLTTDTSVKASNLAVKLLANASAQILKERQKSTLKDLVEDDDMFASVAPKLFGEGFEKNMSRQ